MRYAYLLPWLCRLLIQPGQAWELLCVDNLVVSADTEQELVLKLNKWKDG